jgi:Uncharacterized protein conserved in bacteria (DUF2333)
MAFGQWFGRQWRNLTGRHGNADDSVLPGVASAPAPAVMPTPGVAAPRRRRWLKRLLLALLPLVLLYYMIGAVFFTRLDDNLAFVPGPKDLPANGSRTIAMMSGLMDREVNGHGWTPDNPWFYPTYLMDNMPNFQTGILKTVRQTALELKDHVARLRGAGGTDQDLEDAFQSLNFPADKWFVNTSAPFVSSSSGNNYNRAVTSLRKYNARVASGQALFEKRSDTLGATLDRIALSLGNASNALDQQTEAGQKKLIDFKADDVFYDARGEAYAAYLILASLRSDYSDLIAARQLNKLWDDMQQDLRDLVQVDPMVVTNGKPGGLISNDLVAQNAKLGQVRSRLREVTNILLQ